MLNVDVEQQEKLMQLLDSSNIIKGFSSLVILLTVSIDRHSESTHIIDVFLSVSYHSY